MAATTITTNVIGFGLVGVGVIAEFYARAIAEINGAKLIGVATRNSENAQRFTERHGVPFHTTDVEQLVSRHDVHIVCITTPSGAHLDPALLAIRAGKHVVVEKPVEITVERVRMIVSAAFSRGVIVAPIFQARFGSGAQTVKSAVTAGRFGRLVLASVYVKWSRSAEYYNGWKGTLELDGGGALMNQSIHGIDLLQWIVGMPSEVFAWSGRRVHTGIEAEDTAVAVIRFADGTMGAIEGTTAAWPGWSRRLEICGELGSVVLEDDAIVRWDFRQSVDGDDKIRSTQTDATMKSGASSPTAMSHAGHLKQLQDVVDAVRQKRLPAIDANEAVKAVAIIRAIYDSAASGKPTQIVI